jgi:hypothetical protein
MGSFKHNRKRNSGLVYEFLVRRLGQSMVEQDQPASRRALEIMRKYFGEGTALAHERELFEVVRNARGLSEGSARRVMAQVAIAAGKLDHKKIDIKKSCLIKEINHMYGRGFFAEHRIPEYRLLASIQMVIDTCRGGPGALTESVSRIQLEEGLVQYMTTRGSYGPAAQPRSEVDGLVMRMVAKRFGEKYGASLAAPQKVLLERYIRYQVTGDERPLRQFIEAETARIHGALSRAGTMKDVKGDPEMARRLDEARTKFNRSTDVDVVVEELMLYQKLAEEIESDE